MAVRLAVGVFAVIGIGGSAAANAQDACARLMSLKLPDTTLTEAQTVPDGDFKVQLPIPGRTASWVQLPAHCRVTGSIKPTPDSDIRFELWLPVSRWNHRYRQVGNGGLAGVIADWDMVDPLLRGSATASTDDGHEGTDGPWASGHPEKVVDYAYRAVHLTALAAESLVQAYYGQAARHTYFTGCSDGGRESLMEAERYPEDFDGYLVGAPGIDIPNGVLQHLHVWQALHALGPEGQLSRAQLEALSRKVLERCDAVDGVKDGQLRDPRQCPFKAAEAQCTGSSDDSCLSAAQAAAVQAIYDGPKYAATGEQLAPGNFGTMGAEAATWPGIFLPAPSGYSVGVRISQGVLSQLYGTSIPDLATVNLETVAKDARLRLEAINSDNPDLRAARRLGRKILQFHGWADPNIAPQYSVNYFEAVQKFLGSDTGDFYRLFMVPGMAHCAGGVGPTTLGGILSRPGLRDPEHDWVSALENWVERGVAPKRMIATEFKFDRPTSLFNEVPVGTPIKRTRPLCAYPAVAVYNGSGNPDDAASFRCEAPSR